MTPTMSLKLKGIAAAPGIAIAPLVRFHSDMDYVPTRSVADEDLESERTRLTPPVLPTIFPPKYALTTKQPANASSAP